MRSLFLIVALWSLVSAKPEMYKEKEDFEYSRSSTDEGNKSGYYGAQRGNMGGNYERAHNMDSLAQHQMSGAVRQVEGELGDTSKARAGSVYTSANSRGIYGTGVYDLTNLGGRSFQEGVAVGDSRSQASLAESGYNARNAYSSAQTSRASHSDSRYNSAYQRASNTAHTSNDLEANSNLHSASGGYGYERNAANSGYQSNSGYERQSSYDDRSSQGSNGFGSNTQTRLIAVGTPARVIIRPGSTITIPVAAQAINTAHSSAYDQNVINSEAESLANGELQRQHPTSNSKHYESAYNYRKEWEKHSTRPVAVPLAIQPVPQNSELYDEEQLSQNTDRDQTNRLDSQHSQRSHSSNAYSGYNANSNLASSSQSRYQTDYNQQHGSSSSNIDTNAASSSRADANIANINTELDSRPKSYQSSYSYHKSWERQGDPYVIVPSSNSAYENQASQRLTTGASNSHQYDSQYRRGCIVECDPNIHLRVARSTYNKPSVERDQFGIAQDLFQNNRELLDVQQTQNTDNLNNLGQQLQNSEDLLNYAQLSHNNEGLTDFGQQTQNSDDLMYVGQQTQNSEAFLDFGQQAQKSEKFEDFGQQTQNTDNLENFSQVTQNQENINIGQQSQKNQDVMSFGQQAQSSERLEDFGQQSQNTESLGDFSQQTQNQENQMAQHQSTNQNEEDFGQLAQNSQNLDDFSQQAQSSGNLANFGQQSQQRDHIEDQGQQIHNQWNHLDNFGQQTTNNWNRFEHMGQESQGNNARQNEFGNSNNQNQEQVKPVWEHSEQDVQVPTINTNTHSYGLESLWGKIDSLEKEAVHDSDHYHSSQNTNIQHSDTNLAQNNYNYESSNHSQSSYQYHGYVHHYSGFEGANNKTTVNVNQVNSQSLNTHETDNDDHATISSDTVRGDIEEDDNQPIDIGRGDIGSDLDVIIKVTTTIRPSAAYAPKITLTDNRPFESPTEIESLSLTQNQDQLNHVQKIDNGFNVVSLQEWMNRRKPHENSETTTQKVMTKPIQESYSNLQIPEEVQQSNTQHVEDFMQTNDNSYQQTQNTFANVENLGQQVQTVWDSRDILQQVHDDTQQIENFGSDNSFTSQGTDFYNQQQLAKKKILKNETAAIKIGESEPLEVQLPEITTTSAASPTESKGFWSSVGDKFSNAKDKVVSWFKS